MVTVRFFGPIVDAVGSRTLELRCETLEQVIEACTEGRPSELAAHLGTCAVWVNGEPPAPSRALRPGDEVAFLSPVSGG